jgi:hypothetical protein
MLESNNFKTHIESISETSWSFASKDLETE